MFGCRRVRGLIAAALYEKLEGADQAILDRHLSRCSRCRAIRTELAAFVQEAPRPSVPLDVDLLPRLRSQFNQRPSKGVGFRRRPVLVALAMGLCVALGVGVWLYDNPAGWRESGRVVAEPPSPVSAVGLALRQAQGLIGARKYQEAYRALERAVDANPNDPNAGKAVIELARLSFEDLHWYRESDHLHNLLRTKYLSDVNASPDAAVIRWRWNELAESREQDFASLYALDEACADRTGKFKKLEAVVTRYPRTYVASTAAREMLLVEAKDSRNTTVAEAVKSTVDRCTDPVAKELLAKEFEGLRGNSPVDTDKVRALYQAIAQVPNAGLSRQAEHMLAQLDATPRMSK